MSNELNLPKWAQDELKRLRGRIATLEYESGVARQTATSKGATGKITVSLGINEGFPLHDRSCIDFIVDGQKISVMLRENGTLLDINAASGNLAILPRAANCAYARSLR